MKKKVMLTAWEIAREGAKKFGGNVREYFSIALKQAWELFKKYNSYKKNHLFEVSYNDGMFQVEYSAVVRVFKGFSGTSYYVGDKEVTIRTFNKYSALCHWSHMDIFGNVYMPDNGEYPVSHMVKLFKAYEKLAFSLGLKPKLIKF